MFVVRADREVLHTLKAVIAKHLISEGLLQGQLTRTSIAGVNQNGVAAQASDVNCSVVGCACDGQGAIQRGAVGIGVRKGQIRCRRSIEHQAWL